MRNNGGGIDSEETQVEVKPGKVILTGNLNYERRKNYREQNNNGIMEGKIGGEEKIDRSKTRQKQYGQEIFKKKKIRNAERGGGDVIKKIGAKLRTKKARQLRTTEL